MIISHKYKFIFLKTNKTAGTSVEIALSKFCGANGIITPVTREDEKIRRQLGYPGPQNCLAPITDYGLIDWIRLIVKAKRKLTYYNHISAVEVKELIGEQIWNNYFKFCIERNPWDRFVSFYYWCNQSEPRPPISDFLNSQVPLILKRRGFEVYTINGKIAVDRVCFFENLKDDLEEVRVRLGLPEELELPRAKSSYRKDRRSYREVLNANQRDLIKKLFNQEISYFGYEF